MSEELWTVAKALKWITARFSELGIASARLDAELLLAETLGLSRLGVITHADQPLSASERARLRDFVRRRQQREPVAYILGKKGFRDFEVCVGPGVMIPRPETEFVVDVCADLAVAGEIPAGNIADLGSGSGIIAIALQRLWPERQVLAIEKSAVACSFAATNIAALAPQVKLLSGEWCQPLAAKSLALAVSNPPYVAETERISLAPELMHEPAEALFADHDGLADLRRLATELPGVLVAGGWWVCEVGAGQRAAVEALLQATGWQAPRWRQDYSGHDRVFACKLIT